MADACSECTRAALTKASEEGGKRINSSGCSDKDCPYFWFKAGKDVKMLENFRKVVTELPDSQQLFWDEVTLREAVTSVELDYTLWLKKLIEDFFLNVNTFSFDSFLNEMFPLGNSETFFILVFSK